MKSDLIMRVHVYVFLKTLKRVNDWSRKFNDVYIPRDIPLKHTHILHHCSITSMNQHTHPPSLQHEPAHTHPPSLQHQLKYVSLMILIVISSHTVPLALFG